MGFLAFVETAPLLVQTPVAGMPTGLEGGVDLGPAGPHRRPGIAISRPVMPGRLDQQTPHVGIAGLGDRPLNPRGARGILSRYQPDVGADRGSGKPAPI